MGSKPELRTREFARRLVDLVVPRFFAAAVCVFATATAAGGSLAHGDTMQFHKIADAGVGLNDELDISPSGERVLYFHCNKKNCTDRALVVLSSSGEKIALEDSKEARSWKSPHFVDENTIVVFEPTGFNDATGQAVALRITDDGGIGRVSEISMPHYADLYATKVGGEIAITAVDPGGKRIAVVSMSGEVIHALKDFPLKYAHWLRFAGDMLWFRAFFAESDLNFLETYGGPATLLDYHWVPYSRSGYEVLGFIKFNSEGHSDELAIAELFRDTILSPADFPQLQMGAPPKSWIRVWDLSDSGKILLTTMRGIEIFDTVNLTSSLVVGVLEYEKFGIELGRVASLAISDDGHLAMLTKGKNANAAREVAVIGRNF